MFAKVEDLKPGMFVESYPYRVVLSVEESRETVSVVTGTFTGATKTTVWQRGVEIDLAQGWD